MKYKISAYDCQMSGLVFQRRMQWKIAKKYQKNNAARDKCHSGIFVCVS